MFYRVVFFAACRGRPQGDGSWIHTWWDHHDSVVAGSLPVRS